MQLIWPQLYLITYSDVILLLFSITDAVNDTRDKVKFLEGLKRHFEVLHEKTAPDTIISQGIVPMVSTMRQTDSVSRYYCRTGFLGALFWKVS